jgi:hypothetical protein
MQGAKRDFETRCAVTTMPPLLLVNEGGHYASLSFSSV